MTIGYLEIERNGLSLTVEVQGIVTHTPGCLSGPPEDCYPEETEVELTHIPRIVECVDEDDQDREPPKGFTLTDQEYEEALDALVEAWEKEERWPD